MVKTRSGGWSGLRWLELGGILGCDVGRVLVALQEAKGQLQRAGRGANQTA